MDFIEEQQGKANKNTYFCNLVVNCNVCENNILKLIL